MAPRGKTCAAVRSHRALCCIGYALYLVFGYALFHPTLMLSGAAQGADTIDEFVFIVAIMGARIVAYAVTSLGAIMRAAPGLRWTLYLSCASVVGGSLVVGMLGQFSGFVPSDMMLPWMIGAGSFFGLGDALANLLWARYSSTFSLRGVYVFVLVANLASLVVYAPLALLPQPIVVIAVPLLFIGGVLFAARGIHFRPEHGTEFSLPVYKGAIATMWRPVLGTAILAFLGGLMLQLPAQRELSLSTFQVTSLLTQPFAIAVLLVFALLTKRQPSLASLFKVALPLSAAGFLLLPLIWNDAGGLANALAQLGHLLASIIMWCMLADTAHDTKLPVLLLFSPSLLIVNVARLAGTMVAYVNAETLMRGDIAITEVALVVLYLVVMMSLFLFKDKRKDLAFLSDARPLTEPLDVLTLKCSALADRFRFTPREREILLLLAQGRTVHAISEKLFVSENTVKSHIKSIYVKLDIHARSELIDLIDAERSTA